MYCIDSRFVLVIGAFAIYAALKIVGDTTFLETIYSLIQTPLQGLTDSVSGVIVMGLMIPFLWFFGVHGSTIIGGIMDPILTANTLDNQAILDVGKELTLGNGGHIVTKQFLDQFMTVTGAGMTIGIVIFCVFFAKSAKNKEIGRISSVPALFNINEPVLFGFPVTLNPMLVIPFMAMPTISGLILYFCQYIGIIPLFGGWQTALL
ncbi:PTS transporter subunit EIIC [Breznakia sp. PFB1-12]|uniref:PTS transporter subunit EIIC n=1 Tax=unclassified Breznakia TaxID=2623764 RepID=UPI0032B0043A